MRPYSSIKSRYAMLGIQVVKCSNHPKTDSRWLKGSFLNNAFNSKSENHVHIEWINNQPRQTAGKTASNNRYHNIDSPDR